MSKTKCIYKQLNSLELLHQVSASDNNANMHLHK